MIFQDSYHHTQLRIFSVRSVSHPYFLLKIFQSQPAKYCGTKLVPPKTRPENQILEPLEETSPIEQKEVPKVAELDIGTECPCCHELTELQSNYDKLMYSCESCSFLLKCV